MYSILALLVAVAFLLFTLGVPFGGNQWVTRFVTRVRRAVVRPTSEALFRGVGEELNSAWVRVWGATSAVLFSLCAILDEAAIQNDFQTVVAAGLYGSFAAGTSAFLMVTCLAYWSYVSRTRGYAALRDSGFHALWLAGDNETPKTLRTDVSTSVHNTHHVGILAVTGFDALGKGPGPNGGLLHDALASATHVPVSLFLLLPDAQARDPDRRQATVSQTILADMGLSAHAYHRRLRTTLEAVADLNEWRPPEAQIEVHYYNEKPTFQAVLFENSALISPLTAREHRTFYTHVRRREKNSAPSFFEMFRRQFIGLADNAGVKIPTPARKETRRPGTVRIPMKQVFKAPSPVSTVTES